MKIFRPSECCCKYHGYTMVTHKLDNLIHITPWKKNSALVYEKYLKHYKHANGCIKWLKEQFCWIGWLLDKLAFIIKPEANGSVEDILLLFSLQIHDFFDSLNQQNRATYFLGKFSYEIHLGRDRNKIKANLNLRSLHATNKLTFID